MKLSEESKKRLSEATDNLFVYDSLINYIEQRQPVGDFLQGVISNNLYQAARRNDGQTDLKKIILWLYSETPANCRGSEENYKQWIKGGKI